MSTVRFYFGEEKIEFGVMEIPDRKNKALVEVKGSDIEILEMMSLLISLKIC